MFETTILHDYTLQRSLCAASILILLVVCQGVGVAAEGTWHLSSKCRCRRLVHGFFIDVILWAVKWWSSTFAVLGSTQKRISGTFRSADFPKKSIPVVRLQGWSCGRGSAPKQNMSRPEQKRLKFRSTSSCTSGNMAANLTHLGLQASMWQE